MTRPGYCFGVLALSFTTICASQSANETHTVARKLTVEGVPNFGEVNSTLYRGAQPTHAGFEKLARMGSRIVVDARERGVEGERKQVIRLRMRHVAIPWYCFHPEHADIARFLTLIRKNRGKKVFVHCQTGDDRTGMMIAAYRMAEQGWTAQEAMREMEAFGFTSSHHVICPSSPWLNRIFLSGAACI